MHASSDATPPVGIILRPRRVRLAGYFLLCVGFVVIGGAAVVNDEPVGWFVGGVFAVGAAITLVGLLPGASYLRLAADGLTVCSLFRRHFFAWGDVAGFGVTQVQGRAMVGLDVRSGSSGRSGIARLSRAVSGYDAALPDTYGLAADELAAILNRALGASRGSI